MADYSGQNSVGGRLRRYGQVAGAVGGFAGRYVGNKYLGWNSDMNQRAEELAKALGGIKGPLMKAAQLLSTIPDAVPEEYVNELGQLQSNAPPMGWPFVKRRMAAELGHDWQQRFARFDREAAHAASLGQVHRATIPDGREVAVKLQYPDMQSAVEADLRQLRWALQIYEKYDQAIATEDIHAEIAARLYEELDYGLEGKHMKLFGHMLAEEPSVHVPEVIAELSTDRLLTMTWLAGHRFREAVNWPQEARNEIAYRMFRAWYVPFYNYGVIHGDPHLGNYTIRDDKTINLLDFGCVRIFPPELIEGVIDLYYALRDNDEARAVKAYEAWGFKGLNREVIDTLNMWAEFVYAPLMDDRQRPMDETNSGAYGRDVAQKVHNRLREVGGVSVPRSFVFMDRAAVGLGSVFLHLNAEVNWHRAFMELVEDFDIDAVRRRRQEAFPVAGLAAPE